MQQAHFDKFKGLKSFRVIAHDDYEQERRSFCLLAKKAQQRPKEKPKDIITNNRKTNIQQEYEEKG